MPKRNAIATICIGDEFKQLAKITHPLLIAYAQKCGADFLVIDTLIGETKHAHHAKLALFDYLDRYERVAYIDTDILAKKDARSLFDVVPEDCFGVWLEDKMERGITSRIAGAQAAYGSLPQWKGGYFNAGLMVASKKHREIFSVESANRFQSHPESDQSYFNWRVRELNVQIFELSQAYNHTVWKMDAARFRSSLIHHIGTGAPSYLSRPTRLRRDKMVLSLPSNWQVPVGSLMAWVDRRLSPPYDLTMRIVRRLRRMLSS